MASVNFHLLAPEGYRLRNRDASVSGTVAATDATTTAITALTGHTVYVQTVTVVITTSAAQIITIKDSANTPVVIGSIAASAALGSIYTIDFGAKGFALTAGKNLLFTQTAGPAYSYTVEAYQAQTSATQGSTIDRT